MRERRVLGASVALLPLAYLILLNLSQVGRLSSPVGLAPLSAADAWLKALLHTAAFLGLPLLGAWIALGSRGLAHGARQVLSGSLPRPAAVRLTAWASLALLGAVLAASEVASPGSRSLFSLDTSRAAFSLLPLHAAIALSAAAAVSEEALFRGLGLRALRTRMGPATAITFQAIAFGAIHIAYGSALHAAMATVFGVLLAVVALRAGLGASMLLHFEVNVVLLSTWSRLQPTWPIALGVAGLAVALLVYARRLDAGAPAPAPTAATPA